MHAMDLKLSVVNALVVRSGPNAFPAILGFAMPVLT